MTQFEKPVPSHNAIGIFVILETTETGPHGCRTKKNGPFQLELRIHLPPEKKEGWLSTILLCIHAAENGNQWPLRFTWDNAKNFLTIADLLRLERSLGGISISLYGAPPKQRNKASIDVDKWYTAKKAASVRMARHAKKPL